MDNILKILAEEHIEKVEQSLNELDIKLKDENGDYKSFYDILGEISKVWDKNKID